MPAAEPTFPLVLRRRLIGLAYGAMHSARRGMGSDVAGSRPYRPGDDIDAIDWAASARLSSAHAQDEFVVRERFAEEAPRVVLLVDRRPAMALYPPGLPWFSKPEAIRVAGSLIAESTVRSRGLVGYLDYANGDDDPFWRPPSSKAEVHAVREQHLLWPRFEAPPDNMTQGLRWLQQLRGTLTPGSLLFVLSDFLVEPDEEAWARALERRWDLVPVVVQDPVWETSFPDVGGVTVPVADPATGTIRPVRMTRREARARRAANEKRHARLLDWFRSFGLDPVVVASTGVVEVLGAFLAWADERLWERRGTL
jgi:uncharacterized protein (DUF58 family)